MRFSLAILISITASSSAAPLSFNRDIRPILSNNCYKCHGPDNAARKAKLRLDREADSRSELKSGSRAIVPSDAVFDRMPISQAINLFDMNRCSADVVETSEVVDYLAGING